MSDELVNTLENLGLFFGGATGRLTRDYGELSGDNFQMMAMHADPEKLAKDLASLADAAARIRLLEQQLKTAREEERERCAKVADEAKEMRERLFDQNGGSGNAARADEAERISAAIRSLGEPSAHPPGE